MKYIHTSYIHDIPCTYIIYYTCVHINVHNLYHVKLHVHACHVYQQQYKNMLMHLSTGNVKLPLVSYKID